MMDKDKGETQSAPVADSKDPMKSSSQSGGRGPLNYCINWWRFLGEVRHIRKLIKICCAACGKHIKTLPEEEFIKEYLGKMDVYLSICSEECRKQLRGEVRELKDEEKPYG